MARLLSCSASAVNRIAADWECVRTTAGAALTPADLGDGTAWLPAVVPGTYASALSESGGWDGESPLELDQFDVWYRTRFTGGQQEILHFEGIATISEVWLNRRLLLRSENMFQARQVTVRTLETNELHICCRSLAGWLQSQRGRPRWRTRLATPGSLRFARTTLLGRMPGWCPVVHAVGPWRPILRRRDTGTLAIDRIDARASVHGGDGRLAVRCMLSSEAAESVDAIAEVDGKASRLARVSSHEFAGDVFVPLPELWWPHTHGTPHLHQVTLRIGDVLCDLGRVGFRDITVDCGPDGRGFTLRVNGEAIFCRGACWTTPNLVRLPSDAASYRPLLAAMRDAGMNMVRVSGTMVYETDDFYTLCDELGLLVWQDVMLANFDYPETNEFRATVAAELAQFLDRTQLNPSLAVLCGGSEVLQQAVMVGIAHDRIDDRLYAADIPEVVRRFRPDMPYVINSPSGGAMPFQPDTEVSHYYGVGAYLRPFDDARRAAVRFASECLAIANVPCAQTVDALQVSTTTDPRWKQAVPRDPGADWDFDDVRDHYLAAIFKVDPQHQRDTDFERYLDLSRAVSCILMEEVFNEWRRVGSVCRGGLVWQLQDVRLGAGWGVIDSLGRRKPAWYALQRVGRTRQIILTDEGLNGLAIHVVNETDTPFVAIVRISCLRDDSALVREGERIVTVSPRSAECVPAASILSGFFDITDAYRFGPRGHDTTIATLHDVVDHEVIADAWHLPDPSCLTASDLGLQVRVEQDRGCWFLRLLSRRVARFLHIDDEAFTAAENWLHLAPGRERRIGLLAPSGAKAVPRGEIRALNMDRIVQYAGSL